MLIAISMLWINGVAAQESPITWSLKTDPPARPLRPGDTFTVKLIAQIEDGWHLFSTELRAEAGGPKPTRITLPGGQPFELAGKIESPAPKIDFNQAVGMEVEFFEGTVTFKLPVKVSPDAAPGRQKLRAQVKFQTCSDSLCMPVSTAVREILIDVEAKSVTDKKTGE